MTDKKPFCSTLCKSLIQWFMIGVGSGTLLLANIVFLIAMLFQSTEPLNFSMAGILGSATLLGVAVVGIYATTAKRLRL